jgi:hypothetical protein
LKVVLNLIRDFYNIKSQIHQYCFNYTKYIKNKT